MLAKAQNSRAEVTLVPRSGVQFVDFSVNIDGVRLTRSFFNKPVEGASAQAVLVSLTQDSDGNLMTPAGERIPQEQSYSFSGRKACEVFLNRWVPVPFFLIRERIPGGRIVFGDGPSNWVRAKLVELSQPDEFGNTFRLITVFDTALVEQRQGRPYLGPTPDDVVSGQEFAFAADESANSWFLAEKWVDGWLSDILTDYKVSKRGQKKLTDDELENKLEHWALYITFTALIDQICDIPFVRFIDTISKPRRVPPVDVDLVLDVGNSRTCGILVETVAGDGVDLNNSYPLELRDLTDPQFVYDEAFPSRIEFAQAIFGNDRLSRRSGRTDAFQWQTVARVGVEALRLSCLSEGSGGNTGLSSPKRYLWDTTPRSHQWMFNRGHSTQSMDKPITASPFMHAFREDGEVRAGSNDLAPVEALYSRSSLMCFFLCEIFLQAFTQINSVSKRYQRSHHDVARRLKRVILTMPTAMPIAERRIFSRRATAAVQVLWSALEIDDDPPQVILQWDEASATQMVFLFNEIKHCFSGDATTFFDVCGRTHGQERPNLRIASIDIGGGTTDLIITSYELEGSAAIKPLQEFREGFNLAGDDILCAIIERHLLPSLLDAMRKSGVADAVTLLATLLGDNRGGQTETERTLRKQFATQVAIPLGLRLVHLYEVFDPLQGNLTASLSLGEVLTPETWPTDPVISFIDRAVAEAGGKGFKLSDVRFTANMSAIDMTVNRVIGQVLGDLCEIIHLYDCDYLLLSGRPSRMPAIKSSILAKMPVMADRIHTMHRYRVGNWYPFRDAFGRIADPKTTAAMGAMVCALSEGQLEKFHLRSKNMVMKSTARFIGEMESSGQIKKSQVFFANMDLDDRQHALPTHTFDFYARTHIGFRQLEVERWPATALYRLDFADPNDARTRDLPFKLTIERATEDDEEDFRLTEATDAEGRPVPKPVLRLQTLKNADGYWVDTGIFDTPK